MKKIIFLLLSIVLFTASCQKEKKNSFDGYEINGYVKNIPDSTLVQILVNNKVIDSTIVIGEKFKLIGKVEKPTNVFLMTKKSRDINFKPFWLENSKIDFYAEKGNFIESKIIGSKTQEEANILDKRVLPYKKEFDSLNKILSNKSLDEVYRDSIITKFNDVRKKKLDINRVFIREYPNSLVSSQTLNLYKTTFGKETTKELFSLIDKNLHETADGKAIMKFIELSKKLNIGDKFLDFEQENLNGQKIKFSNIQKKYTLIEFWASWCIPCRKSNPELVKEYVKYKDKGFEIIGVSLDQKRNNWLKAIEKDGLVWENVSDLKGNENEVALMYGVNEIPDNFLIDENGKIIARGLRNEDLKNKLEELF
ncbi:hypothetical protein ATO12_17255 [Aquimarina atlantica]|uniref:Thioredoxin domain-containing protein n=1 Tax=Aquimarina atlantica TaxID=1317122 RepID=A0A023BUR1_9FLAO|nr:TlpA disulfide reductase family protein [Aquimarina atlantica]EZH73684.1 hypothetical protein ATO12_17255 [Aquimarina atlantica]